MAVSIQSHQCVAETVAVAGDHGLRVCGRKAERGAAFICASSRGEVQTQARAGCDKGKAGRGGVERGHPRAVPPTLEIKGLHKAGLAQQQATPQALCRLMFLLLNNY